MQVAKYWRNKKLRYRLEGLARQDKRAIVGPQAAKSAERNRRKALKREPMRLPQ